MRIVRNRALDVLVDSEEVANTAKLLADCITPKAGEGTRDRGRRSGRRTTGRRGGRSRSSGGGTGRLGPASACLSRSALLPARCRDRSTSTRRRRTAATASFCVATGSTPAKPGTGSGGWPRATRRVARHVGLRPLPGCRQLPALASTVLALTGSVEGVPERADRTTQTASPNCRSRRSNSREPERLHGCLTTYRFGDPGQRGSTIRRDRIVHH